jgi:hypothetical protein
VGASTDYKNLFPIEKEVFQIHDKSWAARIKNHPDGSQGDRLRYSVEFWRQDFPSRVRRLSFLVSEAGLSIDPEQKYRRALFSMVRGWLETDQLDGEMAYFG